MVEGEAASVALAIEVLATPARAITMKRMINLLNEGIRVSLSVWFIYVIYWKNINIRLGQVEGTPCFTAIFSNIVISPAPRV